MSRSRNRFGNAEEMGRSFDTREVTEENSKPATVLVDRRYDPTLTMRIPPADLRKLKKVADARGVPTATMGRMLLLERLREQEAPRTAAVRLIEALVADESLRAALRDLVRTGSPKAVERARRFVKSRAA